MALSISSINKSNLFTPLTTQKGKNKETTVATEPPTIDKSKQATLSNNGRHLKNAAIIFAEFPSEYKQLAADFEKAFLTVKDFFNLTEKDTSVKAFDFASFYNSCKRTDGTLCPPKVTTAQIFSADDLQNIFDLSSYKTDKDFVVEAAKFAKENCSADTGLSVICHASYVWDSLNLKYDEDAELAALKEYQDHVPYHASTQIELRRCYAFSSRNELFNIDGHLLTPPDPYKPFTAYLMEHFEQAGAFKNHEEDKEQVSELLSEINANFKPLFLDLDSIPGLPSRVDMQLEIKSANQALDVIEKNLIAPENQAAFHKISSEFKDYLKIKGTFYYNYEEGMGSYDAIRYRQFHNFVDYAPQVQAFKKIGTYKALSEVSHTDEATQAYQQALNKVLDQLGKLDGKTDVPALLSKFKQTCRDYYTNRSTAAKLQVSFQINFQSFDHIKDY